MTRTQEYVIELSSCTRVIQHSIAVYDLTNQYLKRERIRLES